jgi:hypothetical protein
MSLAAGAGSQQERWGAAPAPERLWRDGGAIFESMSTYGSNNYSLPATAICPGCGTMVTLPPEPLYPDSPPSICATCDTEVPDYRRESYLPTATLPGPAAPLPEVPSTPIEHRRYSRGGLFRSLGGILADRGADAVESAKDRFTGNT